MPRVRDLTGMRFGKLVAQTHESRTYGKNKRSKCWYWWCLCDCGTPKAVAAGHLSAGRVNSCGCNRVKHGRYRAGAGSTTHSAYSSWFSMMNRCTDVNHVAYHRYGGRGIKVCDRWLDFWSFVEDMGERPSESHSIDRINNDGNYEPGNCRWATKTEQASNTSINRYVSDGDRKVTVTERARELGMSQNAVRMRLEGGWSEEEASSTPKKVPMVVVIDGDAKTVREWSDMSGTDPCVIRMRLKLGWTAKEAVWGREKNRS
jgi:hypothetical protein